MLLTTFGANAQVKIMGIGATSCRQYLQEIQSNPAAEHDYFA